MGRVGSAESGPTSRSAISWGVPPRGTTKTAVAGPRFSKAKASFPLVERTRWLVTATRS